MSAGNTRKVVSLNGESYLHCGVQTDTCSCSILTTLRLSRIIDMSIKSFAVRFSFQFGDGWLACTFGANQVVHKDRIDQVRKIVSRHEEIIGTLGNNTGGCI